MNPMSGILLSAVIVVTGKWAQGKQLDIKLVVAGAFLAIALTVMAETNEKFARAFALLIVVAVLFTYGPTIFKKTGLAK